MSSARAGPITVPLGPQTRHGIRPGGAAAAPRVAGELAPRQAADRGPIPRSRPDLDAALELAYRSGRVFSAKTLRQPCSTGVADEVLAAKGAAARPSLVDATAPQPSRFPRFAERAAVEPYAGSSGYRWTRATHDTVRRPSGKAGMAHAGGGPRCGEGPCRKSTRGGASPAAPKEMGGHRPRPGASSSGDPAPARPD